MDVQVFHQVVQFVCNRCNERWSEEYEVRHVEDSAGGVWEHFRVNGNPCASPLGRRICRNCHEPTVSITPLAHAEVVGTESLPGSFNEGLAASSGGASASAR